MNQLLHYRFTFLFALFITASCSINSDKVPISYGKDQCAYCKMTISNPKFGAELITDKGRVLKYDAAECMVNQLNKEGTKFQKLYAVPFDAPKKLVNVDQLRFLISPDFRSPMGANLTAYIDINNLDGRYHKQLIDWNQLLMTL